MWEACRLDDTWIYDPNDGPQGSWKHVTTPVKASKRDLAMMAPYGRGALLVDVDRPADWTGISHGALTGLGGGVFLQSAG